MVAMVVTATILVRSHSLAIDERLERKLNVSTSIRSWGRGRCVALRAGQLSLVIDSAKECRKRNMQKKYRDQDRDPAQCDAAA